MRCDTCSREAVVVVTHSNVIDRRRVTWTICASCEIREMRTQDERAVVAIEEAERSHV